MQLHELDNKQPDRRLRTRLSRGTYVAVTYNQETVRALKETAFRLGLPNKADPSKYHTTIVYSDTAVPDYEVDSRLIGKVLNDGPLKIEIWKGHSGPYACVAVFQSMILQTRFDYSIDLGADQRYPKFKPHITLSYDVPQDFELKITEIDIALICEREYKDDIDPP